MTRQGRYPQELRERAVRMVFEHQDEHPSQWAAICSIAAKFGISHETLRNWVRRAETDDGRRPASARAVRDAKLKAEIARVHAEHVGVYGARKALGWRTRRGSR